LLISSAQIFKKNLFFIFALYCILQIPNVKADFRQGIIAYQKQDYSTAFKLFKQQAEIGEVRSQLNIGIMYFQGQGVKKDVNKAYAWLKIGYENDVENLEAKGQFDRVADQVADFDLAENEYELLKPKYSFDALFKNIYPVLTSNEINEKSDSKLVALKLKKTKYSKRDAFQGIGGWVTFKFNLDPLGKPRDIQVINELPQGYFDLTSIKAIKKWKFRPLKNEQGNVVWNFDIRYTLKYIYGKDGEIYKDSFFNRYLEQAKTGDPVAQAYYGFLKENINDYEFKDSLTSTEWFFKAAKQGVPIAQFDLGKNLINGKGCKQDKSKGIQWLTRAAANGADDASELLAQIAIKKPTKEAQQKAITFLNESKNIGAATSIQFAWLFATSPYKELRDPDRAIKLVKALGWKKYNDGITKQEIIAAAYAAKRNFKKAISVQQDALDEAQGDGYYTKDIEKHLSDYKQNKTWF